MARAGRSKRLNALGKLRNQLNRAAGHAPYVVKSVITGVHAGEEETLRLPPTSSRFQDITG